MSIQLITLDDIKAVKSISINVNQEKELIPYILEAQDFDLREYMGDAFYLALLQDYTDNSEVITVFADVWGGVEYEISNVNYRHEGLKMILIYHAYARYLTNSNIIATPTGFVHKTNQYSEKIDSKELSMKVKNARAGATVHEERVRKFLDHNNTSYPLWKYAGRSNNYKNGLKIRKI